MFSTHPSQHLQILDVEGDVEERHKTVDELEQRQLDDPVVVKLLLSAVVLCDRYHSPPSVQQTPVQL